MFPNFFSSGSQNMPPKDKMERKEDNSNANQTYLYLLRGVNEPHQIQRYKTKINDKLLNLNGNKAEVDDIIAAPPQHLPTAPTDVILAVVKMKSSNGIDWLQRAPHIAIQQEPWLMLYMVNNTADANQQYLKVTTETYENNQADIDKLCSFLNISVESNVLNDEKNYIFSGQHQQILLLCSYMNEYQQSNCQNITCELIEKDWKISNVLEHLLKTKYVGNAAATEIKNETFYSIPKFIIAFNQLGQEAMKFPEMGWKLKLNPEEDSAEVCLLHDGSKRDKVLIIWERLAQRYKDVNNTYETLLIQSSLPVQLKDMLVFFLREWKAPPVGIFKISSYKYVYFLYKQSDIKEIHKLIDRLRKANNLQAVVHVPKKKTTSFQDCSNVDNKNIDTTKIDDSHSYIGVFFKDKIKEFYEIKSNDIDKYADGRNISLSIDEYAGGKEDLEMITLKSSNENDLIEMLSELEEWYNDFLKKISKQAKEKIVYRANSCDPYSNQPNFVSPNDKAFHSLDTRKKKSNIKRNESFSKSKDEDVTPDETYVHYSSREHDPMPSKRVVEYQSKQNIPIFPSRTARKGSADVQANTEIEPSCNVSNKDPVPAKRSIHSKGIFLNTFAASNNDVPVTFPLSYIYQPTRTVITVNEESITEINADAIVNAANSDLEHIGGVARAIADRAGPTLISECQEKIKQHGTITNGSSISTTAGNFRNIKHVIHAVGPLWNEYKEQEGRRLISSTYESALKLAHQLKCRSLAIPMIGSGIFGIPENISAFYAVNAIVEFLKRNEQRQRPSPETIYLVDINPEAVNAFKVELDNCKELALMP